ncbi:MAG: 2,3-bisphosphoglycerate-independent phosphoglycerate mutase [Bacteroidia bacterium]|nr:2,3-bisphosphoglycerate-independent phosphoglycerate mutase [Bacteroidia bacterium]
MEAKKTALIILDGWGCGKGDASDAIANTPTPFYTSLLAKYPHSTLKTFGYDVGLPQGQMGNSEVGHLNIGAGRVVYQELAKINKDIEKRTYFDNEVLKNTIAYCKQDASRALHIMGLVSDGGVHSHITHLQALCEMIANSNLQQIYIHAFTDGRDTDPKSGYAFIAQLISFIKDTNIQLASVTGRYYAMDRDKRWERVQVAYNALVHRQGEISTDVLSTIKANYANGITDEFMLPIINANLNIQAQVKNNDAVICFNFRTDRCREITEVLTQTAMPNYAMYTLLLHYVTFTNYNQAYKNIHVVYTKNNLEQTLGEVIAAHNKTQLRIAETEKYPHVTFFFNGGREAPYAGEERIVVPSAKVATYDLQPEMSAYEITLAATNYIRSNAPDFICLNYANPDMVGHTGVYSAVQKAIATVDNCLQQLVTVAIENNYACIIIADHGNADYMINPDGTPNTAHSTNLVPVIAVNTTLTHIHSGRLADVAPTILKLMNVPQPTQMDGISLLS